MSQVTLSELVARGILPREGFVFLRRIDEVFSAIFDDGTIFFRDRQFTSPSGLGSYVLNMDRSPSSSRRTCSGWTDVYFSPTKEFGDAVPLDTFRRQLKEKILNDGKKKSKKAKQTLKLAERQLIEKRKTPNDGKKKRKKVKQNPTRVQSIDEESWKLAERKRSLAAAMKSTPMKFPNTDEKVGSLLYGGVGAKPSAYAVERNKRVFSNMSKHNLVFPTLGVHRLHFNGWSVLCRSLQDCFEAATNSGKDGMLMVTDCTGRRWTTEYFQGYNSYGKTHADQLDAKEQSKFTTVLPGDRIDLLCSAIGGFSEMLSFCQEFAGSLQFLSAHILRQDSPQARFRWHRDTEQGTNYVLTIVFLLSQTKSTMQVAGFEEVHYLGPGSGVAFPSDSEHRSGHADPGTLKIAIFFGTPAGPGGRVEKVRSLDTDWLVSEDWESCMCTNLYHLPGVTALPFDGIWIQCDGCNRWCHRVCTGLTKKEARTVSYTCPTCIEPTCWCNKLIHVTGFGEFDGHWVGCDNCDMFCHRICTGIAVEDMETASYVCPRCESTISSVVTELVDDIVNILTRFG